MDITKPMFWHQGLFLQPQHFQLEDLYFHSLLAPFHRFMQPHFWGVGSMEIREGGLGSSIFDLTGGEFVFPDGTYVVYPGNAHIQGRSFGDVMDDIGGDEPFTVYLGLRKWNPAGGNVSIVPRLEDADDVATRFVTTTEAEEVKDLYHESPPAQVRRQLYALRLFWSTEQDALNEYDIIPLVQLGRDRKEVILSDRFIAPSLSLAASERLEKLVKQIRDQVASRCRQLEEMKTTRSIKTADFEMGDFIQLLGMRTLARYVLPFHHLTEAADVHPWQVYGLIRQLVGELSTFSERLGAAGLLPDGRRVLPQYDHRNLHHCFSTAQAMVNHLLDEIVLGGDNVIRLAREGGFFVGDMPGEFFDPRFQYYMVMRTEQNADWVVDGVQTVAKLSSRQSIDALTTRFVSGVPLEHVPYPPPGVPRLAHAVYFRVDRDNPLWEEVERTGGVALYWDTAPDDLMVEIAIQKKM